MTHISRVQLIIEGKTGNPLSVVNEHRRRAGLPSFDALPERPPVERVTHAGTAKVARRISGSSRSCATCATAPPPHGPGTELKSSLKTIGVPPCQQCDAAAKKMDTLGVAGCREQIDELAAEMLPRAMEWIKTNRPWAHALLPNVVQEIEATRRLRNLITQAIDSAEKKEKEKTARTIAAVRQNQQYAATKVIWADAGDPIFRIRTAIRVAKRKTPTIAATIASLTAAGFEPPIVYAEPDTPDVDNMVVKWSEKKGAFRSFVDMCLHLLQGQEGWMLICEDDVEFKDGCADFIRSLNLTHDQVVTLYVSAAQDANLAADGLNETRGDMHGSLAYVVHSTSLRKIVDSHTIQHWTMNQRVDRAFCNAAAECGVKILCPKPSLAQHTGLTSTLVAGRKLDASRTSHNYTKTRHQSGLVTLITPTGDRPEAFAICERWVKQQRYTGPVQWIVVDDGIVSTNVTCADVTLRLEPMRGHSLCRNLRSAIPHIKGDHVFIIEDDEYYGPDYLSVMVGRLQHAELVGERASRYYFPKEKKWMQYPDWHHVALCRLGLRGSAIKCLVEAITGTDNRSVDERIWESFKGLRDTWIDKDGDSRMCFGMKGMPGRKCGVQKAPAGSHSDINLSTLRRWAGEDWTHYNNVLQ